jgi:hypothetical protein
MELVVFEVHVDVPYRGLRERLKAALNVLALKDPTRRRSELVQRHWEIHARDLEASLAHQLFATRLIANRVEQILALLLEGSNEFVNGVNASLPQELLLSECDPSNDGDITLFAPNSVAGQLPVAPCAECDWYR